MLHPIEQYRQAKGWTRRELANQIGVSVATVAAWEKGVMPRPANLWKLSELLGVDIVELINGILDWRATYDPRSTMVTVTGPACNLYEGLP